MSKRVDVGNLQIGGGAPVVVQSMCNTDTSDVDGTIKQITALENAGCEVVRAAINNEKSLKVLPQIMANINVPLVADIHFDHRLAIASLHLADKIRINPGNIGGEDRFVKIIKAAQSHNKPIRIGVNLGSLHRASESKHGRTAKAMVHSALKYIELCEQEDFHNIIVSLKASDIPTTIQANRIFSKKSDYPLHLGITEAGFGKDAHIKSSIGIGSLLLDGIGDTIRVSITGDPVQEIPIAYSILNAVGLRKGLTIISCPTCGRTHGDIEAIAKKIKEKTAHINKPVTIAVMGCEVNGPGEARDADFGVAFGSELAVIFKKGQVVHKIKKSANFEEEVISKLEGEINEN